MMKSRAHETLRQGGYLSEEAFERIETVSSGRLVSVFIELRTLMYLGVMLFSAGVGILVYENIGEIGHIFVIAALVLLTAACFLYAFRLAPPYTHSEAAPPNAWFDYVVLLGSLLLLSVQGYLQYRYELFTDRLEVSTFINAVIFFYVGYRFDHAGVLALGITALASCFSISITPQKWYMGQWSPDVPLHRIGAAFGLGLGAVAWVLQSRGIKKHFTFTYLNFSFLIFFFAVLSGLFLEESRYAIYVLLAYVGCFFAWRTAMRLKAFLFLLYAFVAGYIATTYWLADTLLREAEFGWYLYFLLSSAGFIYFIVTSRKLFSRNS